MFYYMGISGGGAGILAICSEVSSLEYAPRGWGLVGVLVVSSTIGSDWPPSDFVCSSLSLFCLCSSASSAAVLSARKKTRAELSEKSKSLNSLWNVSIRL